MKRGTTFLATLFVALLMCGSAHAQSASIERSGGVRPTDEMLRKFDNDPAKLQDALSQEATRPLLGPSLRRMLSTNDGSYVARSEAEPNNFFNTADNIDDVLSATSLLHPGEGNGMLIEAATGAGDVDVYAFTADTSKMYYFASTHSNLADGTDGLPMSLRLFHESDLDTTFVEGFQGIDGIDKMTGDIIGEDTDGRNGSGDFRLTGWTPPR